MLWKLPPGGLAHQAATASSALIGAHRQLGQDTVLELRSIYQQAHQVSASVQRTPALTQPQRHLEHKVQCKHCAVSPLHPPSGVCPQPHSAEHRLQRIRRPQMHPVLDREVIEAHERLPVPKSRSEQRCRRQITTTGIRLRSSETYSSLKRSHSTASAHTHSTISLNCGDAPQSPSSARTPLASAHTFSARWFQHL